MTLHHKVPIFYTGVKTVKYYQSMHLEFCDHLAYSLAILFFVFIGQKFNTVQLLISVKGLLIGVNLWKMNSMDKAWQTK